MADGKTTLEKPMAELMGPGEQLLGGCKAAAKGAVLKGTVGGALGGAAGALVADSLKGKQPEGGFATVVPKDRIYWVGATNQRLVYFKVGAMTSKPKAFAGDTPLEAVSEVKVSSKGVFRRLDMTFADGSATSINLYRANSPESLLSALREVLPGKLSEQ